MSIMVCDDCGRAVDTDVYEMYEIMAKYDYGDKAVCDNCIGAYESGEVDGV